MPHFRVLCSECERQISTCRCYSPHKSVRYEVCGNCAEQPVSPTHTHFAGLPEHLRPNVVTETQKNVFEEALSKTVDNPKTHRHESQPTAESIIRWSDRCRADIEADAGKGTKTEKAILEVLLDIREHLASSPLENFLKNQTGPIR